MNKAISLVLLIVSYQFAFSQKILTSWSQQNIENYNKEMYEEYQKLSSAELLKKNMNVLYWSEVFLTLNASVNHYSNDKDYLKGLANQITNKEETKLKGTSRLIIWDRITAGDILFEGKGLVMDNDLFKVSGRANQILQNLTNKNFGFVTIHSTYKQLEELKNKWFDYLLNNPVQEYKNVEYQNAKIPEISSLPAFQALIKSLQDSPEKQQLTKNCLKKVYDLDEMPKEKSSSASYCNPDTYTFSYLKILLGDNSFDSTKDAKWWIDFWETNHEKLVWNNAKGIYEIK
jgi:hypothetical protein